MVLFDGSIKCNCCYTGLYLKSDGSCEFKTMLEENETCVHCGVTMTKEALKNAVKIR
jgi:hypothetical protein